MRDHQNLGILGGHLVNRGIQNSELVTQMFDSVAPERYLIYSFPLSFDLFNS